VKHRDALGAFQLLGGARNGNRSSARSAASAPGGPRGWAPTLTTIASAVSRGRLLLDACIGPLRPLYGGKRLFGPALTAWCELHAVALASAGDVIVIDASGASVGESKASISAAPPGARASPV